MMKVHLYIDKKMSLEEEVNILKIYLFLYISFIQVKVWEDEISPLKMKKRNMEETHKEESNIMMKKLGNQDMI